MLGLFPHHEPRGISIGQLLGAVCRHTIGGMLCFFRGYSAGGGLLSARSFHPVLDGRARLSFVEAALESRLRIRHERPNQALQPTAPGDVCAGKKFILRRPVRWLSLGR
jgi:hypothetical protein